MSRLVAILVSISIVGMSQGMIVPLLALLLERRGISPLQNGFGTTALYLGVIIASPQIERIVRRIGARRTVLVSILTTTVLTLLFPLWDHVHVWLVLRLLLGFSMTGLYVATEIWLNTIVTGNNRGRVFAFYGLAIAIGMMLGPQGINLLQISLFAPFLICAATYLLPLVLIYRLSDEGERLEEPVQGSDRGWKRFGRIFWIAPFALCASLVYGYLDGALIGGFPIYGSRIALSNEQISFALTAFVIGSIVFQFPLGWLSDRWGRRPALLIATAIGLVMFLLIPATVRPTAGTELLTAETIRTNAWVLYTLLFFAGGALGSFYSLGLACLGDVFSRQDLATANVVYTMLYGVGSLLGPLLTGSLISLCGQDFFAWSVASVLVAYILFGFGTSRRQSGSISHSV